MRFVFNAIAGLGIASSFGLLSTTPANACPRGYHDRGDGYCYEVVCGTWQGCALQVDQNAIQELIDAGYQCPHNEMLSGLGGGDLSVLGIPVRCGPRYGRNIIRK